jgi:hypothetical protein
VRANTRKRMAVLAVFMRRRISLGVSKRKRKGDDLELKSHPNFSSGPEFTIAAESLQSN